MFNLFGRKKNTIKVTDVVWMTGEAKLEAILTRMLENPNTVVLCWFPETLEILQTYCRRAIEEPGNQIRMVREYGPYRALDALLFAEHYPLAAKEEEFYTANGLTQAEVFSALDEPFFILFGAGDIAGLMRRMGMKENEPFSHKMISSSIRKAQEKIAEKITVEQSAPSATEWFRKNMVSGS